MAFASTAMPDDCEDGAPGMRITRFNKERAMQPPSSVPESSSDETGPWPFPIPVLTAGERAYSNHKP
jgi:hypothetical protein